MSVKLEDVKRTAIAVKLADMRAIQYLLIDNDKALIIACPDRNISNRLENLLLDDEKNLAIINTAIVQYGIKAEPRLNVLKMIELAKEAMVSSSLSLFEKVAGHELINHTQAIAGILINKAAQILGADIEIAIAPLNTVNFDNRTHQEQLRGIMEMLSTLELTGQKANQSLWGMVQDTIAVVSGMAESILSDEMSIHDLLRVDRTKVNSLLNQIQNSNDPQKLEEYFGQLYKDLMAHTMAVEEVLYPVARPYHDEMQHLYDEQAKMKQLLNHIKDLDPQNIDEFKTAMGSLMIDVCEKVNEEENKMFLRVQTTLSAEQEKRLAVEFEAIKSKLQDKRLANLTML